MSIPSQSPLEAVHDELAAQAWAALGDLTLEAYGVDLFKHGFPAARETVAGAKPVSDFAVACIPAGGAAPRAYFRDANGDRHSDYDARVNVVVRGPKGKTAMPYALAREIQHRLHLRDVDGFLAWRAEASDPIPGVPDTDGHHYWTVPIRAEFHG